MPWTYRHATREWRAFLTDVKDRADLVSDNMAYTAIDGVFRTFRRRLTVEDAVAFANVLPSVPRAVFVQDWDVTQAPVSFADRAELTREAQALRKDHNLTPDTAIEAVAWALWRRVDHTTFRRCLDRLPPGATEFWAVDANPGELAHRFS
ncbi:MAG: DUF2267 domain-containing protein [Pseudomonadota bacterium]